jgi:hypothetical protein
MLTMSGFRALSANGAAIQDEDWGSGHQAFFLYQVLHALDTDYARSFGWRQATVWGVEEPESALHRDLETRLADTFRRWAHEDKARLQILQTTHSPIFSMAADSGFWCQLDKGHTSFTPLPIPKLTRAAESRGVSSWVHPLLSFPWNPVVLVEGDIDVMALEHAAQIAGVMHLRFLALPQLDPTEDGGGKDAIIHYLKRNRGMAQNRQKEAPLIVLFDWEIPELDLRRARENYGPGAERNVVRMERLHCDQLLGPDFKGIERFYPPSVLIAAHEAGEIVLGIAAHKPFSISSSQLRAAKGKLVARLKKVDAPLELRPLILVLHDIEANLFRDSQFQLMLFESQQLDSSKA